MQLFLRIEVGDTSSVNSHQYRLALTWTGNSGSGTTGYRSYSRDHLISAEGPGNLLGTADVAFRGTPERWNPEQLFLAAIAQCHLLTYLWLAVTAGVNVVDYTDSPTATLQVHPDGSGEITAVELFPVVTISPDSDPQQAAQLHHRVADYSFIARSVSAPITHQPTVRFAQPS